MSKPVSPDLLASGILPFVIDAGVGRKAAIRGRMVRLDGVVDSILDRHQYPPAIAELTAEAMVLARPVFPAPWTLMGFSHCRPRVMD